LPYMIQDLAAPYRVQLDTVHAYLLKFTSDCWKVYQTGASTLYNWWLAFWDTSLGLQIQAGWDSCCTLGDAFLVFFEQFYSQVSSLSMLLASFFTQLYAVVMYLHQNWLPFCQLVYDTYLRDCLFYLAAFCPLWLQMFFFFLAGFWFVVSMLSFLVWCSRKN